jgi:hypothetical protein
MMCFRDMTFCNAACGNASCPLMLTDKVKAEAEKWWGKPNAPIAVSDDSETCRSYVELKGGA